MLLFSSIRRRKTCTVSKILNMLGEVSGLITNRSKSAVYPIHCNNLNMADIMESFECPITSFPCNYLGLPLHYRQLHRVEVQPIIDKMANRFPAWKGRFLDRAGRLKLLNSVLSSIPTYYLTTFEPKKLLIKILEKKSGEDSCGKV